jgi:hypothetical protein
MTDNLESECEEAHEFLLGPIDGLPTTLELLVNAIPYRRLQRVSQFPKNGLFSE